MRFAFNRFLDTTQALVENYNFPNTSISVFRRLVYLLLAIKMFSFFTALDVFYHHMALNKIIPLSVRILYIAPVSEHYHLFWLLMCLVVSLAIFFKPKFWLSCIVFIISLMYYRIISEGQNNGNTLLHFFVFILIFIREGAAKGSERQMLNNVALVALQMGFCILYFLNGVGKLALPFWRDGSFLTSVWQYTYYAQPNLIPNWFTYGIIPVIMSWGVMLFELLFPILVWFKPFRNWLFFMGIIFHLGIIFLLSIPDFGLIMIIGYLLFTNADIVKELRVYKSGLKSSGIPGKTTTI